MADTLPLDGSSLKTKDPVNNMPNASDDLSKSKKCPKSDKLTKSCVKECAAAAALPQPSSSSLQSSSSVTKAASNSYQQQIMNQTQCQHLQKVSKQNGQADDQDQTIMDLQEMEDLRKKRCADRYDSSESSDSGVATLSITDSSATSSEDALNPDSPDNPAINNDLLHHLNGTKCAKKNQQVPNNNNNTNHNKNKQETNAPPLAWPWNVNSQIAATHLNGLDAANGPPPLTLSKSLILSESKNCQRNKRNHQPEAAGSTATKRNRSSNINGNSTLNNLDGDVDATNRGDSKRTSLQIRSSATINSGIHLSNANAPNIRSQTKITGFFKTQMKALPSLRKDLTNMVVRPTAIPHIAPQKDDAKICETSTSNGTSTKLDSLPSSSTSNPAKKVERKTAKVSPISRKSNAMKKSYTNVLPKKHVNIAPRTNSATVTVPSIGLSTMADTIKSHQTKVMQSVTQQPLHVKLLKRQMEYGGQPDYGVMPLLTTIHLPTSSGARAPAQSATVGTVQPNQSLQASKGLQQAQKPNGAIYQLHPTSVIQIPVATKETNTQTANNIVVNNGYFINGAFIKLQQMLAPAATAVDQQFHCQIKEPQQSTTMQHLTERQLPPQKPAYAQQSKMAPAPGLCQDAQTITNHNDLTQHFVTNGASNAQFAQPVFIPTSSGLILTTALPTMLTPQLSNLQTMSQPPPMTAIHPMADKALTVSLEKRSCLNMQIPQQTLAVTLPADNNIQSNFLTNSFAFGMNATQSVPMNHSMVGDKQSPAFNRTNLLSSQPFNGPKIVTTTANQLSLPVTFSLSAPPPLCVQSKDMVQSTNHLTLSNPPIAFASNSMVPQMPRLDSIGNKISNGTDFGQSETANHDSKANSKTIETLDTSNLTDSLSNNISTKQISSVRDTRDSQQNDLKLPVDVQQDKADKCVATADADGADKSPTAITVTDCMDRITVIDTDLLNNASLPECSKSPILSQPKTIRFPANGSRHANDSRTAGCCYWDDCNENCETSSNLLDHLQTKHVNPQTEPFSCRWANCKVHGRESCSRKWLERHVLSHGGSKLFKCIFEKCRMRFGSQLALQKHVNGHFNNSENKESTLRRSSDPPVPKKLRVNGKRLRYRRQPFSARMFDYFDNGVMEELQHRLLHTVTITNGVSEAITFKGRSIGRRVTATGSVELLIKWTPSDIISDEWMSASKSAFTKTVQLTALTQSERISLMEHLNYLYKFPTKILPTSSTSNNSPSESNKKS